MAPGGGAWGRIRCGLNGTDALVFGVDLLGFLLFITNVTWRSTSLVWGVTLGTILLFAIRAARDATLRRALTFGCLVALLWAGVEAAMVHALGWWGSYLVHGPRILETPVYCLLVGATAATYVAYLSRRASLLGFRRGPVAGATLAAALLLAVVGEALFVAAGFWTYVPWSPEIAGVPLVVPLAYGLPYAAIPWIPERRPVAAALRFQALTAASIAILCLLTGFPG